MGRTMTALVQLSVGIMDMESWKSLEILGRALRVAFCKFNLAWDPAPAAQ